MQWLPFRSWNALSVVSYVQSIARGSEHCHMDIIALNLSLEGDASEAEFEAILNTAAVLGKYGVRGSGKFSVEIGDDSVKLRQANVKF